jgi:hypothetical protein
MQSAHPQVPIEAQAPAARSRYNGNSRAIGKSI